MTIKLSAQHPLTKEINMNVPHPHEKLGREWLANTSLQVWMWDGANWRPSTSAAMLSSYDRHPQFAVGHKPHQPPTRMCELAGIPFPEPLQEAPPNCSTNWVATAQGDSFEPIIISWSNKDSDRMWLEKRLLHTTKEAATSHGMALVAAMHLVNMGSVESAK